jgi:uncharacterized membrane protein SpoIIM required for sporulation
MKQQQFVAQHQAEWLALQDLLDALEAGRGAGQQDAAQLAELPARYRRVCNHYALARSRRYGPALVNRLKQLVWQGHRALYRQGGANGWRLLSVIPVGFPRTLREHAAYFWTAVALFLVPAVLVGAVCFQNPDLIYSVLGEAQVAEMESMYDPANRNVGRPSGRSSETDFVMFGFYIYNNISVGFRTFAGGIAAGIGTLLLLLFNGVVIGGVAGHLTRLGYQDTFWPFVVGHGSFELTAIVICGAAGLAIGHAVIAPGQLSRFEALRQRALGAVALVMGAAFMLLVAAFIEAFWSSNSAAMEVKYAVAGVLWLVVILYLTLAGRARHELE